MTRITAVKADVVIVIARQMLSDQSEAWDVIVGKRVLNACSANDALLLANKIKLAIEEHTVNNVYVDVDDQP